MVEKGLRLRLEEELIPLLRPLGVSLYDMVVPGKSGGVLKIFVESPEGVTLDKLESVSRCISDRLDVLDPFSGSYRLEVSSPGLDRVLKLPQELEASLGKHVKVRTNEPIRNQKVFRGRIESIDGTNLVLTSDVGKKTVSETIPFGIILEVKAEFWRDLDSSR
jgi:ribosome maturation factor RimP